MREDDKRETYGSFGEVGRGCYLVDGGLGGELIEVRVACLLDVAVGICVGVDVWGVADVDVGVLLHVHVAALVAGGAYRVDWGVHEGDLVVVGANGGHGG